MYPAVWPFGLSSTTSKLSIRPSCCMRPERPMDSLKTSRARSSRPRTGSPQLIISTRSAILDSFMFEVRLNAGPSRAPSHQDEGGASRERGDAFYVGEVNRRSDHGCLEPRSGG